MVFIIIFKGNILDELKNKGYTTYILQKKVGIPSAITTKLKKNDAMTFNMETIYKICTLLDCQPGDILEYVPDDESAELAITAEEAANKKQKR